jgi:hypothetical protein
MKGISQGKLRPRTISRRVPSAQRPIIKRHSQHVGEITIAWNWVNASLMAVFETLVNKSKVDVGITIWHFFQSDKQQRELLRAIAGVTLPPKSRILKSIEWLVDSLNDISTYRNDAVHAAISFHSPENSGRLELLPDGSAKPPSRRRLTENPTKDIWIKVQGDLNSLASYASSIFIYLHWPGEEYTLPRRPRLLSVPKKKKRVRKRSRPPAATKHQPPRGS